MGQCFSNPWPGSRPQGLRGLLRWTVARLVGPLPKDPPASAFPIVPSDFSVPRAPDDVATVTWVGHSTLLIQIAGRNVLTDPVWSNRASPVSWAGPKRVVPPAVNFGALPPIDLVVISHNHYDHLDVPTVRRLAARWPEAQFVVPTGLASFVRTCGAREVTELGWWQDARVAGVTCGCVPAQHFSQRRPGDRNRTLWCGWTLEGGGVRVYFAGDTGYHPEFGAIARRFGPFDILCLPVGAYEPRWFMRPMHMNPDDALKAFSDLAGAAPADHRGVVVPVHWGTFKLTDEALDEPPTRTQQAWRAAGLPLERLWLVAHGETRRMVRPPAEARST